MKFRSRKTGAVQRLASTSGHILLVGDEFVEVPEHMEAEAYANGCISEELYNSIKSDMEADATAQSALVGGELSAEQKAEAIKAAITAMLDSAEEGAFTAAGLPNLKVLSKATGFSVSKEDMEAAWAEVSSTVTAQPQA